MGFCFFNNVGVGVEHARNKFSNIIKRVAVIDWDVHHGNGTQAGFLNDLNVLFISIHEYDLKGKFYPRTGSHTGIALLTTSPLCMSPGFTHN
jgi:histone deacetylase 6